jgi:hypothetical protein
MHVIIINIYIKNRKYVILNEYTCYEHNGRNKLYKYVIIKFILPINFVIRPLKRSLHMYQYIHIYLFIVSRYNFVRYGIIYVHIYTVLFIFISFQIFLHFSTFLHMVSVCVYFCDYIYNYNIYTYVL